MKPTQLLLSIVILLMGALLGCKRSQSGVDTTSLPGKPKTTQQYWAQLHKIVADTNRKTDPLVKKFKEQELPDELIQTTETLVTIFSQNANQISALPIAGVDPLAVNHAADFVALFTTLCSAFSDAADLCRSVKASMKDFNPDADVVTDAIEFFVFNSTENVDRRRKVTAQQHAREQAIGVLFKAIEEQSAALRSSEMKVRATLGQRYDSDFEPL